MIINNTQWFRFTKKGQIEVLNSAQSVFVGEGAGANQDNSAERCNVFIGYQSRYSNTGINNTASGYNAVRLITTGNKNTASWGMHYIVIQLVHIMLKLVEIRVSVDLMLISHNVLLLELTVILWSIEQILLC